MWCRFCINNAVDCSPQFCQNAAFHDLEMAAHRDRNDEEVENSRNGWQSFAGQEDFLYSEAGSPEENVTLSQEENANSAPFRNSQLQNLVNKMVSLAPFSPLCAPCEPPNRFFHSSGPFPSNLDERCNLAPTSSNNYPLSANLLDEQDEYNLNEAFGNNTPFTAKQDEGDKWRHSPGYQTQHWDICQDSCWSQHTEESCFSKTTQFPEATKGTVTNQSLLEYAGPSREHSSLKRQVVGQTGLSTVHNFEVSKKQKNPVMERLENMNLGGWSQFSTFGEVDKKDQESQGHWMDVLYDPEVQARKQNKCTSPSQQVLNCNIPPEFIWNACDQTGSCFIPGTQKKEEEEEVSNAPMFSIEYYIQNMEIKTMCQPMAKFDLSQCRNLRKDTFQSCSFCRSNWENRNFCENNSLKDGNRKVICPVLTLPKCPDCFASGDNAHTKNHCTSSRVLHGKYQ